MIIIIVLLSELPYAVLGFCSFALLLLLILCHVAAALLVQRLTEDEAKDQLVKEREEKEKALHELQAAAEEIEILKAQLNEATKDKQIELLKEQKEKAKLSHDLDAAAKKNESLMEALNQSNADRERLTLHVSNLSSEVEALKQSDKNLISEVSNLSSEVVALRHEVSVVLQKLAQLQTICKDEETDVDEKSSECQPTQAQDDGQKELKQTASCVDLHEDYDANIGMMCYFKMVADF